MKPLFRLAVLALLAACGNREDAAQAPAPAPAPVVEARDVVVADVYGEAGAGVRSAAFWTHPTVAFAGLVVTGGPQGLRAYGVEQGEEVARVDTVAAEAIAIGYRGEGAAAEAIVAVETAEAFAFYAIDNATRAFSPLPAMMANRPAKGFCFDGATLYRTTIDGVAATRLAIEGGMMIVSGESAAPVEGGLAACAVDLSSGDVVAISDAGALYRISPLGAVAKIADTSLRGADGLGYFEREGGARIVALDGEAGVVRLFDAADGREEGAIRLAQNFDHPGTDQAVAIAVSFGNLGGLYRDGALALVAAGDNGAPVRATSWNSVLSALGLQDRPPIDPRAPRRRTTSQSDALIDPAAIEIEAP